MAKVSITLPNRASIILETEDAGMVREALALLLQTPAAANGPPPALDDATPAAPETPAPPLSANPPPEPAANGNPADANTLDDAAEANAAAYPARRHRRRQAYRRMRARHHQAAAAPGVDMPSANGIPDAAIPPPQPAVAAPPPIPDPETPANSANGLPPPVAPPPAAPIDAAVVAAAPPPIPPGLGIPGTVIALEAGLPTPYDIPRESAAGLTALGDTAARLIQPAAQVAAAPSASDVVEATPPCAIPVSEILTDTPPLTCAKPPIITTPDYAPVAPPPDAPSADAVQTDEARPVAPPSDDVPPPGAVPVVALASNDMPPPLSYAPLVDEQPPEDDMPDDAPPIDALPDDDMDDDEPYYAWNSNPNNAISVPVSSVNAGNYAWTSRLGAAAATPSMARRSPAYAPAPGLAPEPSAAAVDGAASGGLRLAEQPRPAREAFTAFCRSVNPLGDMRRVVVAAEGAARCFATDGVDADELGELFDLAGWRRPPNFTQTLRNAARSKFGWLERIPGRTGRYAPTNLGRTETIPTGQRR